MAVAKVEKRQVDFGTGVRGMDVGTPPRRCYWQQVVVAEHHNHPLDVLPRALQREQARQELINREVLRTDCGEEQAVPVPLVWTRRDDVSALLLNLERERHGRVVEPHLDARLLPDVLDLRLRPLATAWHRSSLRRRRHAR